MNNTYLAITIGPIYKTLQKATSTRELWSASFCFSLLMEALITEFSAIGTLLSPSSNVKFPLGGAGVFPDRCFFQNTKACTKEELDKIRINALDSFASKSGLNLADLEYFQIYIVQKEIADNPIKKLNIILDGLELNNKYSKQDKFEFKSYWQEAGFFKKLYKIGFGKGDLPEIDIVSNGRARTISRFKSIPEIASYGLERLGGEKYRNEVLGTHFLDTDLDEANPEFEYPFLESSQQVNFMFELKKAFKNDFKFHHKYFTIVQADGDNVGKLIAAIENAKTTITITDFSNTLNEFVKEAVQVLSNFGAFPIYLGGDDLLFFAPISNGSNEGLSLNFEDVLDNDKVKSKKLSGDNVFFLVSALNELFKSKLQVLVSKSGLKEKVSLSFGLSAAYYKKPMQEIQKSSYDLLINNAKKKKNKNYIALQLEKHSGQSFEFGFEQNTQLYFYFLKLTNQSVVADANFLNSVMFKLNDQKNIVYEIASDIDRLEYFFKENFNEAGHIKFESFFSDVIQLINLTFQSFEDENNEQKINRVFSSLKFIQFLTMKDENNG